MTGPVLTVRAKVLFASIALLAIPYVGYRYVNEMEGFLRAGLEDSVLDAARALAGALHGRSDLIQPDASLVGEEASDVYAYLLGQPMQIDGYVDDWEPYLHLMRAVPKGLPEGLYRPVGPQDHARYLVGKDGAHLYALVRVVDDVVTYGTPELWGERRSDHVVLSIVDIAGRLHRYLLATPSPGWMTAYELSSVVASNDESAPAGPHLRSEPRIRAGWQATANGFDVEVRIPLTLVGSGLSLTIGDVDTETAATTWLPDSQADRPTPRRLVLPSAAIEALVQGIGHSPGRRFWVVDRHRRVLAKGGSLQLELPANRSDRWWALLLPPPSAQAFTDPPVVGRLGGETVEAALAGQAGSQWGAVADSDAFVVSAASPVWNAQDVVGAVVVEQTSAGIQTVRRQALAELVKQTLLVGLVAGFFLLWLATGISTRLRRLRDETENAIDDHGRVVGQITKSRATDEIGDLSRSFSAMSERLAQYNHYLEQLARRLSHELRTPIAIVRSSVDSLLLHGQSPADEIYAHRALDGVKRLDTIIIRMSEAARLEQALEGAEPESFALEEVVAATVEAYRSTWPQQIFEWRAPAETCRVMGVPDLIVQLLDKLISNAIEFSTAGQPISIALARIDAVVHLELVNLGPPLPAEMEGKLFDSMVSIRPENLDRDPHLGLGLYIVRLIAEFHGGGVRAENLRRGHGVRMLVTFPVESKGSAV